jgi:hypothetical protein
MTYEPETVCGGMTKNSSISRIGSLKWKERRNIENEIKSRPINSSFGKTAQARRRTRAVSLQSTLIKIDDDVADVVKG